MPRSQTDAKTALLSVRISKELHDDLKAAAGEESGIATEVRQRLAASFAEARFSIEGDQTAAEALRAIVLAFEYAQRDEKHWSDDPAAFAALFGTIRNILAAYRPEGDPTSPEAAEIIGKERARIALHYARP